MVGLVVQPGMLERLRAKGVVICLHATPDTILQRTGQARVRPLLEVADPEARIRQLNAEREATYKQAGTVILTDFRPLHDVVMHVLRTYRREARDWERAHGGAPVRAEGGLSICSSISFCLRYTRKLKVLSRGDTALTNIAR